MAFLDSTIINGNLSVSGKLHTYKLFIDYRELTILSGTIASNKNSDAVVSASQVIAYTNSLKELSTYITTFVPEITYSTSTGFTVTNFSKLLQYTNTSSSDWEVGILWYHAAEIRTSRLSHSNNRYTNNRHFRTTWNYMHFNGADINIDPTGKVSNTETLKTIGLSSKNDTKYGQQYPIIGIRIRCSGNRNARSRYSKTMYEFRSNSDIVAVNTSDYIRN